MSMRAQSSEMARQADESSPAPEDAGAPPVRYADALDRSLEALRDTLESAEKRWRELESRLEEQDRTIRELQNELHRERADRRARTGLPVTGVPELTEIVMPAAASPGTDGPSTPADGIPAGDPAR